MFNEVLPSPSPSTPPLPRAADPGPRFPIYLLPSLNMQFRRRRQSSNSSSGNPSSDMPPSLSSSPTDSGPSSPVESSSPKTPSSFMPMSLLSNLLNKTKDKHPQSLVEPSETTRLTRAQPNTIKCSTCASDFAFGSQLVSKGFTGRYGRAYLVAPPDNPHKAAKDKGLINIKVGRSETRLLVTGSHVVADITCAVCHTKIGWKYIDAKDEGQKYKIGKFILETQRVVVYRSWEDTVADDMLEFEMDLSDQPAGNGEEPIIFDSDDEDECEDLFAGCWDPEVAAKRRARKVNRRQKTGAH